VSYWTLAGRSAAAAAQGDKMQAGEDYEALVVKAKEGDVDAIEEWLSSLERDPNSQALLLGPRPA
jgi:type II secretory pathway component GspD/PulD (secretin)